MRPAPTTTDAAASRGYVHLREGIEAFLRFARGKVWSEASMREKLHALSVAVRRPALDAMRESERRYREQDAKRLYYLSMEFLMGRALGNNLIEPRPLRRRQGDHGGAGRRSRGARGPRARRRPRQRRSRTAGGLLPRLAGHARHARLRLRHQLRVRPLPPDVRQRLPAREARSLARWRIAVAHRAPRRSGDRPGLRLHRPHDRERRVQALLGGLQSHRRRAARHADRRLRRARP